MNKATEFRIEYSDTNELMLALDSAFIPSVQDFESGSTLWVFEDSSYVYVHCSEVFLIEYLESGDSVEWYSVDGDTFGFECEDLEGGGVEFSACNEEGYPLSGEWLEENHLMLNAIEMIFSTSGKSG